MTIFLIIHIIITVLLVGTILLQKSSADGLAGMGGGGGNNFMSGRGVANALTKATAILATLFIANSLLLAILASNTDRGTSIIDKVLSEDVEFPAQQNLEQQQLEEMLKQEEPAVPFVE